jgi:hypothetical protein
MGSTGTPGGCQARITATREQDRGCALWVKSRHGELNLRCPLYPQYRTLTGESWMSVKCHKRTFCAAKGTPLFDHLIGPHGIFTDHGGGKRRATVSRSDHLVGAEDKGLRKSDTERVSSLEI